MLAYAADENFNGKVFVGILRVLPEIDMLRVQDTEMYQAHDPDLLEWTARENRVLLTHDVETMPPFAYARMDAGLPMPGVFLVKQDAPVGPTISELCDLALYSYEGEWDNQVAFLPVWGVL